MQPLQALPCHTDGAYPSARASLVGSGQACQHRAPALQRKRQRKTRIEQRAGSLALPCGRFRITRKGHDGISQPGCIALGARYVALDDLLTQSDIITLHCPLTPQTYHLIDGAALARMRPGAMLINTSRGALLDAQAAIEALKSGQLGYLGLDVYEEEADLFFEDLSNRVLRDDVFARLLTFPNVIITGHQAFFTQTALTAIAETTMANLTAYAAGQALANLVPLP